MAMKQVSKNPTKSYLQLRRVWLAVGVVALLLVASLLYGRQVNNFFVEAERVGALPFPTPIIGRDGSGSAVLGGKLVWLFGDTFYNPKGQTESPVDVWRSMTSSYTSLATPFSDVQQPVDGRGNPYQTIPLTEEEIAYNRSRNNPQDRYVVWPTSQVALDANTVLIYFQRFLTTKDKSSSTGVAILKNGQDVASRLPGSLFSEGGPQFRKAMVKEDFVYIYANECAKLCPIARAPLTQATERSAYSFWDGKEWSTDITKAKGVITPSNYGYDVMWNEAIKRYVQVMIGNLSNKVYLSYAKQPQGPWSKPRQEFTLKGNVTYVPYLHPELGDGKTAYMTYSRDDSAICKAPCTDTGGVEIMKLNFK